MSNTSITNVQNSDTFQVWINKTNELIDLANSNVLLAGLGTPIEVTGNAAITGTFTANTLVSSSGSIGNLSVLTLERSIDVDEQIVSLSPMKIESNIENIFDLQTSAGNKPNLRMINGGSARWVLGHQTDSGSSGFGIGTEGASTPQVTISQSGRLTANELEGNGSLLISLNASNITSGTLAAARLADLDASKVTTGIFDVNRIPDLNADKITSGTINIERGVRASVATAGIPQYNGHVRSPGRFYGGSTNPSNSLSSNRMNYDGPFHVTSLTTVGNISAATFNGYIPANAAIAITAGNGLAGGGPLESNITIGIDEASIVEATAGTSSSKTMTPRRTAAAITARAMPIGAVYIQFPGYSAPSSLFGGTWSAIFDNEGIFFRTPGGEALSFGGGIQLDQIQRIFGEVGNTDGHGFEGLRGTKVATGPFSARNSVGRRTGSSSSSNQTRIIRFDTNDDPNVRSGSETRPRNRTVRVWVRTA